MDNNEFWGDFFSPPSTNEELGDPQFNTDDGTFAVPSPTNNNNPLLVNGCVGGGGDSPPPTTQQNTAANNSEVNSPEAGRKQITIQKPLCNSYFKYKPKKKPSLEVVERSSSTEEKVELTQSQSASTSTLKSNIGVSGNATSGWNSSNATNKDAQIGGNHRPLEGSTSLRDAMYPPVTSDVSQVKKGGFGYRLSAEATAEQYFAEESAFDWRWNRENSTHQFVVGGDTYNQPQIDQPYNDYETKDTEKLKCFGSYHRLTIQTDVHVSFAVCQAVQMSYVYWMLFDGEKFTGLRNGHLSDDIVCPPELAKWHKIRYSFNAEDAGRIFVRKMEEIAPKIPLRLHEEYNIQFLLKASKQPESLRYQTKLGEIELPENVEQDRQYVWVSLVWPRKEERKALLCESFSPIALKCEELSTPLEADRHGIYEPTQAELFRQKVADRLRNFLDDGVEEGGEEREMRETSSPHHSSNSNSDIQNQVIEKNREEFDEVNSDASSVADFNESFHNNNQSVACKKKNDEKGVRENKDPSKITQTVQQSLSNPNIQATNKAQFGFGVYDGNILQKSVSEQLMNEKDAKKMKRAVCKMPKYLQPNGIEIREILNECGVLVKVLPKKDPRELFAMQGPADAVKSLIEHYKSKNGSLFNLIQEIDVPEQPKREVKKPVTSSSGQRLTNNNSASGQEIQLQLPKTNSNSANNINNNSRESVKTNETFHTPNSSLPSSIYLSAVETSGEGEQQLRVTHNSSSSNSTENETLTPAPLHQRANQEMFTTDFGKTSEMSNFRGDAKNENGKNSVPPSPLLASEIARLLVDSPTFLDQIKRAISGSTQLPQNQSNNNPESLMIPPLGSKQSRTKPPLSASVGSHHINNIRPKKSPTEKYESTMKEAFACPFQITIGHAIFALYSVNDCEFMGEHKQAAISTIPRDVVFNIGHWYKIFYSRYATNNTSAATHIHIWKMELLTGGVLKHTDVLQRLPRVAVIEGVVQFCVKVSLGLHSQFGIVSAGVTQAELLATQGFPALPKVDFMAWFRVANNWTECKYSLVRVEPRGLTLESHLQVPNPTPLKLQSSISIQPSEKFENEEKLLPPLTSTTSIKQQQIRPTDPQPPFNNSTPIAKPEQPKPLRKMETTATLEQRNEAIFSTNFDSGFYRNRPNSVASSERADIGRNEHQPQREQQPQQEVENRSTVEKVAGVCWRLNDERAFFMVYDHQKRCISKSISAPLPREMFMCPKLGKWHCLEISDEKGTIRIVELIREPIATRLNDQHQVLFRVEGKLKRGQKASIYETSFGDLYPPIPGTTDEIRPNTAAIWCRLGPNKKFVFAEFA